MAFHGFMLLRDEEDVIRECMDHLLTWIDGLYILDLGSTDSTWEIVQEFAAKDQRVHLMEHAPIVYSDNLRCYMFDRYRDKISNGDWVFRLDADEFYHVPPPQFVKERLSWHDSCVHLQWYFFRLTHAEVAEYESGNVDILEDRKRSIIDRRRYYKISEYPEPRMFKYRRSMQWPETISFPYNAGYVARERMPILHYPHRDPIQMARRYCLRAEMMKLKAHAGGHWILDDWRKDVVDLRGNSASQKDAEGVGKYSGVDSGDLFYWQPGTQLKEVRKYNHVKPLSKRAILRAYYDSGAVYLKDRSRPVYNKSFKPTYLSEEANQQIGQKCVEVQPFATPTGK